MDRRHSLPTTPGKPRRSFVRRHSDDYTSRKSGRSPNGSTNSNQPGSGVSKVRVVVRIRPLNGREISQDSEIVVETEDGHTLTAMVALSDAGSFSRKSFAFDQVFGVSTPQQVLFEASGVMKLIEAAVDGYSTTIFAYGQTGSGKTYTISGSQEAIVHNKYDDTMTCGILPRSLHYIYQKVKSVNELSGGLTSIKIKASYLEIHNEQVNDLLNLDAGSLGIRYTADRGFFVENQLIVECTSVEDLLAVFSEGHKNRQKAEHELNRDSSRSHCIMTVYIESTDLSPTNGSGIVKCGKVSFVDLAGSERLKDSKTQHMKNIIETGNINRSLFALGQVISALGDVSTGKRPPSTHIPYRNSVVTKLLKDSLGGSGMTLMIACVSPAHGFIEESLSTLQYATRARNIENKPSVRLNGSDKLISTLKSEIKALKKENELLKHHQPESLNHQQPESQGHHQPSSQPYHQPLSQPYQRLTKQYNQSSSQESHNGNACGYSNFQPTDSTHGTFPHYQGNVDRNLFLENAQLRTFNERLEQRFQAVMVDNDKLSQKLERLEQIFVQKSDESLQKWSEERNDIPRSNECAEVRENDKQNEMKLDEHENESGDIENESPFDVPEAKSVVADTEMDDLRKKNCVLERQLKGLQERERVLLQNENQILQHIQNVAEKTLKLRNVSPEMLPAKLALEKVHMKALGSLTPPPPVHSPKAKAEFTRRSSYGD